MAKRKRLKVEVPPKPDPKNPKTKVICSISGGKDSTAMSLWLKEQGIEHLRVFADTGWEHPLVYEHVQELEQHLGPIHWVKGALGGMVDLVIKKGMFPSKMRRFCTEELKVKPILQFVEDHAADPDIPVINTVGIRSLESVDRSKMDEWEFYAKMGIWVWRPLIKWTVEDVLMMHHRHNVPINPLYRMGFGRVGCWPCVFANKKNIARIAEADPGRIDLIRQLEIDVQSKAEARYEARGETFESLGYMRPSFFILRRQGKAHMAPIDEVVEWSKTAYGGKQFELWNDNFEGCARWGLCDIGDGVQDRCDLTLSDDDHTEDY